MNRLVRSLAFIIGLFALFALIWTTYSTQSIPKAPPQESTNVWTETNPWAETQLAQMTLEQKVSQLFSSYAYGHFTSEDDPAYERLVDLVENFEVGSLIFFQGDPMAQAAITNDLQLRSRVPLLISQDMEWGPGMRLENTTKLPRTMALGATRDPDLAYAAGYVTAQEARALGVQQIYAPVADVNNNPRNPVINVRSFGETPELVSEMVTAFVKGAQDGGVIATAKHFPGHGDTAVDSHYDLPIVPHNRSRLDSLELVPFRAAVDAGIMSIMTAHLALPELEPDNRVPATLSPKVMRPLLRDNLGFQGLIVTDALRMRGVTKYFGVGEAAIRALEAGADMLLLTDDEYAARQAILSAITSGRLTADRIDSSVRKILQAKAWAGLTDQQMVDLATVHKQVMTQPNQSVSETIARQSLTLLRNQDHLLPLLDTSKRLHVITLNDGDDTSMGQYFVRQLRQQTDARISSSLIDRRSNAANIQQVLARARTHDVILVPAFSYVRSGNETIGLPDKHRSFLNRLIATNKPVVLISFGNPYMVTGLPKQPAAYLTAYGGADASQKAVAQALFGRSSIAGKLPVTIPEHHSYGDGIDLPQVALRRGYPEEVGMASEALTRVDSLIRASIQARTFPGAAVAIGRRNVLVKMEGYGYYTYDSEQPVTQQSRFDMASLTKVVATTTATMKLYESGLLALDDTVSHYLPAFGQNGKEAVTIHHLLTHTAGLPPFRPFHTLGVTSREAVLDTIMATRLDNPPGFESRYSDFSMITLALVIEKITGQDFASYAKKAIFDPLGMKNTGFRPAGQPDTTIVPTEVDDYFRNRLIQGEVHDETAWILGGTAGHAGLFSTVEDLSQFAYMMVNGGRVHGEPFLKEETIRLFTTPIDSTRERHTRALGWDTKSPEGYSSAGELFGPNSFGHTGFTGTSLWIDTDQQLFAILLTNRVYPTRDNRGLTPIRPAFADIAYEAVKKKPEPLMPSLSAE